MEPDTPVRGRGSQICKSARSSLRGHIGAGPGQKAKNKRERELWAKLRCGRSAGPSYRGPLNAPLSEG
jgi:hypothetical protein